MKQIVLGLVLTLLICGMALLFATHNHVKRVVVLDAGTPVPDVTVSIFLKQSNGESTLRSEITDENGVAEFGTGLWTPLGKKHGFIIGISKDETIYWEGVVTPDYFRDIILPIDIN